MTDSEKNRTARHILSAEEAETFKAFCAQNKDKIKDLTSYAGKDEIEILSKLYRLFHPSPECPHPDWEKFSLEQHPLNEEGVCKDCGINVALLGLRCPHPNRDGSIFHYPEYKTI